jgi:hypothetical protein
MAVVNPFPRLFTVDEANALLPEIRQKVSRMKDALTRVRAEIEKASREANLPPWSPELTEKLTERGVASRLVREVRTLIEQINDHGCLVNGPEAGLVDFPCLMGSEIVFLCWKLGEPRVGHWHRIPDGFAGRRTLLDDQPEEEIVH